ncbi:MAG: hypothetical protein JSS02_28625 [Planctomycetes bacterium]|nr:hypothetical protein [Planctomycetota bacterium]
MTVSYPLTALTFLALGSAALFGQQSSELDAAAKAIVESVSGETAPSQVREKELHAQPGLPAGEKPAASGAANPKPADGGKPDEKDKPKTTQRPNKPESPPNPEELKVRPDEQGRVRFNFHGQPWQNVLEWLARISSMSLDWQELPADYLNLRTQRSYTLDEARDLINRHLLDRGFTLLKHGEVLSAVNIKKIDPSLVPRVSADDLDERESHEFVKVLFPLDSLTAEAAVEELKPLLSPNGKLFPLKTTNRVEAMDAAINLREIRDMLSHEQSTRGRKRIVREFRLEYTRAADVMNQVQDLLGQERKKPAGGDSDRPQNPRQQMMQQEMLMAMEAQEQRGGQPGAPKPAKAAPQVHLVVNSRENSLIVQAPADQMAIVAEAVKLIDVPSSRPQNMTQNVSRTRVYRLAAVDPEPLIKMLEEVGNLDPATRLQVDKRNRAIIAHASLADHLTIQTLVKKLDGTDRRFEVIKLRRLEADYVAGSIEFMMGAGEKKKSNNRFYPFFDYFGMGGGNNNQEEESRKFRVDADTEHNRLLLWANDIELEEINHLLVKLGEISAPGGNPSTLRVLDTIPPEEADQLLQKLRRSWLNVAPNPLEIDQRPAGRSSRGVQSPRTSAPATHRPRTPARESDSREAAPTEEQPPAATFHQPDAQPVRGSVGVFEVAHAGEPPTADDDEERAADDEPAPARPPIRTRNRPRRDPRLIDADIPSEYEDEPAADEGAETPLTTPAPPVRVTRGPDGKVIIASPDAQALDRFEDLVAELSNSGRRDYKIFRLKYKTTWAYGVASNLKDFFDDKLKKEPRTRWDYIWGGMPNNSTEEERRLSKRRPLKFISDSDSNSILVTGADPNQLQIIQELIDLYDIPESKDSAAVRKTRLVQIQYSKARAVADAVKEVYRDLLSANDPALQNQQNQQNKKSGESMYTYINNFGADDKKPESPAKFKGQLSIGVVEHSNSLLVSAAEGLADSVVATIEQLDRAALPSLSRMRVVRVNRTIDANELQKRLKNLVTKPPQPRQPGAPNQQPGQQQNPANPDSVTIIDNN